MDGNDGLEEKYRRKAERERERKIADLESLLLSDDDTGNSKISDEERSRSDKNAETDATVGDLSRITANDRIEELREFLLSIGLNNSQTKQIANKYSEVTLDETAKRALESTAEYASARKSARQNTRRSGGLPNIHKGHRQRMRESARRDKELDSFSDIEILEMLLSYFVPQKDTNPIAHALLDKYGSLLSVIRAPTRELVRVPSVTRRAAELIPMLSAICLWDGGCEIKINSHADAANFFGSIFLGGNGNGTYAAYLDGKFGLIAVEKTKGAQFIDIRTTVGSVCKYSAKYVILSRRSSELLPESFNVIESVDKLSEALRFVDAKLLDFLIFNGFGYFTLGISAFKNGGENPEYLFVPQQVFAHSPELLAKLTAEGLCTDDTDSK